MEDEARSKSAYSGEYDNAEYDNSQYEEEEYPTEEAPPPEDVKPSDAGETATAAGDAAAAATSAPPTEAKSKKPSGGKLKQQCLPAWQPILTAGTVLPTFFLIGIAFIPIGVALFIFSNEVKDYEVDYTFCTDVNNSSVTCAEYILERDNAEIFKNPCSCKVYINVTELMKKNVYLYYGLTNYYQNHRRYVKSRDKKQLQGNELSDNKPHADCFPYDIDAETKLPIAPCGAIANSLFNDEVSVFYTSFDEPADKVKVELIETGIAWDVDKEIKFGNPKPQDDIPAAFNNSAKPPGWKYPVHRLDVENENNNGYKNEDLIVWMRNAALPKFRKLYRRINHEKEEFKEGLTPGQYEFTITYNYRVTVFKGSKQLALATTSWMGGRNPFLGFAYITVGVVCLFIAVIFLFIHFKYGKSAEELLDVTPQTPYQ